MKKLGVVIVLTILIVGLIASIAMRDEVVKNQDDAKKIIYPETFNSITNVLAKDVHVVYFMKDQLMNVKEVPTDTTAIRLFIETFNKIKLTQEKIKIDQVPKYVVIIKTKLESHMIEYYGNYDFMVDDKYYKAQHSYDAIMEVLELIDHLTFESNQGCSLFMQFQEEIDEIQIERSKEEIRVKIEDENDILRILSFVGSVYYRKDNKQVDKIEGDILFTMTLYSKGQEVAYLSFANDSIYRDLCEIKLIYPEYVDFIASLEMLLEDINTYASKEV